MPLFEFECRACGCCFETLVRGDDLPACPSCKGRSLERILSSFAVSSAGTRAAARQAARRRNSEVRREMDAAEQQRIQQHHD